jgi:hypothetical protein
MISLGWLGQLRVMLSLTNLVLTDPRLLLVCVYVCCDTTPLGRDVVVVPPPPPRAQVSQLFRVNSNKGQGQPSKIERDYVNPMRVLLLSFPPDVSDQMRDAQFRFERAMADIGKATAGYRKDLPVEVDSKSISDARRGWDEGRAALNDFFALVNAEVGLGDELRQIPPPGPDQFKQYGRSARRFSELQKRTKLCQNRGGPALSQAWGEWRSN